MLTPVLLLSDGLGTYLELIEFTFVYSGDDIVDLDWKTHCMISQPLKLMMGLDNTEDPKPTKIAPESIRMIYTWKEENGRDETLGIAFLFCSGLALALISIGWVTTSALSSAY